MSETETKRAPLVIMSEMDAYVHERLKSQPQTLEDIKIKDRIPEGQHALSLPVEIKKYGDKFSFRWLSKNKRSIDRALDVIGWTLVNRTLFTDIPDHLFTANGVIERGDAILAFMPAKQAERIRNLPGEKSRERVKNLLVQDLKKWTDKGEQYYKPDLGSAEADDDKSYAKGNRGMFVQPDVETIEE